MKKIVAITQARIGSIRLPGKVLKKIGDETLLDIHLNRVLGAKCIDELVLATTYHEKDDSIAKIGKQRGISTYRGSEEDVLDRYYQAAKSTGADIIIRITSDCPLIDPLVIDKILMEHLKHKKDFTSNIIARSYPDGMDVEIFNMNVLERAWKESTTKSDREHVTHYIWKNSDLQKKNLFTAHNVAAENNINHSDIRMTLDYLQDYEMFKKLIDILGTNRTWLEYAKFLKGNSVIRAINQNL